MGSAAARAPSVDSLLPSLPLRLPPGQSDAGAEIDAWGIQQPSRTSLVIVLILPQAAPVGWRNWLEEEVEVVLTVLNQAGEAAYSVLASDSSGGGQRGSDRRSGR